MTDAAFRRQKYGCVICLTFVVALRGNDLPSNTRSDVGWGGLSVNVHRSQGLEQGEDVCHYFCKSALRGLDYQPVRSGLSG
jgi:hypothetical protein